MPYSTVPPVETKRHHFIIHDVPESILFPKTPQKSGKNFNLETHVKNST
jgi:hypothetical protein